MAVTKQQKQEMLSELSEIMKAPVVVFSSFTDMNVGDDTEMRKTFRDNDVQYHVYKKTLVRRVAEESNHDGSVPDMEGTVAVSWSDDPTGAPREVYAFQKSLADKISIQGGIFEGVFKNREEMLEIAQIPGMDELRGMLANVLNAPVAGLAIALSAVAEGKE
jgi:large subunit ribosomal protein L10